MSKPLVTCGITAFNAANSVARAVHSALRQTWRPLEIVVVDDASTDATPDILARLATSHSEVRTFRMVHNSGVAAARNRIVAEARGEFVAFFDDDDESLPDRIAAQFQRIVAYERQFAEGAPVICHTARRVVYPDGSQRIELTMGQAHGRRAPAGPAVSRRILLGRPLQDGYGACPTCSQMARLSTYRALGGFDPVLRRSEDTDFNIRLAEAGGHFVGIGDALVTQTVTRTAEKSLASDYHYTLQVMAKHRGLIEHEGQYDFCRAWMEARQAWFDRRRYDFARLTFSLLLARPILTGRRLALAIRHLGLNRALRRGYANHGHAEDDVRPA